MPKDFSRTERLGEQIRRELSELIRLEVKDPRVGMVSLTDVRVAKDLSHAKIYVTRIGEQEDRVPAVDALNHASGFLKRALGKSMRLRAIPNLRFYYDLAVEEGARMENLIDQAVASDANDEGSE